ncbi:MAG TPA: hypothetical protein DEV96_02425, partial [Rhodospirillum rubrum]|nr:hypothetical protein [Rhodospirillum rubrum]
MLNFYNHFIVPDVPDVTIFHDDQDPTLFYMLSARPTVVRAEDDTPLFNMIAFARDFKALATASQELPQGDLEGGLLDMTVSLEVSAADQQKIRAFIQGQKAPFLRFRPMLMAKGLISVAPLTVTKPIKLTYPTWVDGKVDFNIIPGDMPSFVKARGGSDKPSLVQTNIASYQALLGQEGVRLLRFALQKGVCPGTLAYDVSFVARIPKMSISIKGNAKDVYEEIKTHTTVRETYSGGGKTSVYQFPAVNSLSEMRSMFASLDIKMSFDDFRPDTAGSLESEATKKIEEVALDIALDYLKQRFCSPGFSPGLKAEKLGVDPLFHDPNKPANAPPMPANQLWLKDFKQEMEGELDFNITAQTTTTIRKFPNAGLDAAIPRAEIEKRIVEADLSKPIFSFLDVPIRVNADFEADPIAQIKVFCAYDQTDEITHVRKTERQTFDFDTGTEKKFFRAVMAKRADGSPKDSFSYSAQIVYKSSIPAQDVTPVETTDRSLTITYEKLSCVNVRALWGAIPADVVQSVTIAFTYPAFPSPTSTKEIILSPTHTEDGWFTYTGGNKSLDYTYETSFLLTSGKVIKMPPQTSQRDRLIINAPFIDSLEVDFVAQGDFSGAGTPDGRRLTSVLVEVTYEDAANHIATSTRGTLSQSGERWTFRQRLIDGGARAYSYRADLLYSDGTRVEGKSIPGDGRSLVFVGETTTDILDVTVVASLIDFAVYRMVTVILSYADPANSVTSRQIMNFTAANLGETRVWRIGLKDPA